MFINLITLSANTAKLQNPKGNGRAYRVYSTGGGSQMGGRSSLGRGRVAAGGRGHRHRRGDAGGGGGVTGSERQEAAGHGDGGQSGHTAEARGEPVGARRGHSRGHAGHAAGRCLLLQKEMNVKERLCGEMQGTFPDSLQFCYEVPYAEISKKVVGEALS